MSAVSFGEDVTVYSHWKKGREDIWVRTVVRGVSWYGGSKVTVGDNGLVSADHYAVRIREQSLGAYVLPDIWDAIATPPSGVWSIQNGDVVVKGAVHDEVSSGITAITRKYKDCFVVSGVYDNRRELLRHLKVEGK